MPSSVKKKPASRARSVGGSLLSGKRTVAQARFAPKATIRKRPASSASSLAVLRPRPSPTCNGDWKHRAKDAASVAPVVLSNESSNVVAKAAPDELRTSRRVVATVPTVDIKGGVAVPTSEWREVPKGVPCPRGCEYRMDIETGVNMVRLPSSLRGVHGPRPGAGSAQTAVVPIGQTGSAGGLRATCTSLVPYGGNTGNGTRSATCTALVPMSARSPLPHQQAAQLHSDVRSRRPWSHQADVFVVDNPCPQRSSGAAKRPEPDLVCPVSTSAGLGLKAVHRESTQKVVSHGKDGSRDENRFKIESREVYKQGVKDGPVEKRLARRHERVQKLSDGRTVVTETVTFQKVTVLS